MVNQKSLKRFLQYRLSLIKFQRLGFEKVFSYNLGKDVGVTAEQVRKDFSMFGLKGSKRGGYDIKYLLKTIDEIFKRNGERQVIIIGMGNIGQALCNYQGFKENNIIIVAGFDLDPAKYSKKYAIPVHSTDKMEEVIKKNSIRTAIIAVPEFAGQEVCDQLVSLGIKGILNFSPVNLKVPEDIVVNYVNLRNELESLFYYT
ncbi:MAG: redox-sensing transcriptional repressor Rex [Bacteroidales bacterium]|nr:redox-sensing transcriptional repressor Rex [Bacteroidales bacterium]